MLAARFVANRLRDTRFGIAPRRGAYTRRAYTDDCIDNEFEMRRTG